MPKLARKTQTECNHQSHVFEDVFGQALIGVVAGLVSLDAVEGVSLEPAGEHQAGQMGTPANGEGLLQPGPCHHGSDENGNRPKEQQAGLPKAGGVLALQRVKKLFLNLGELHVQRREENDRSQQNSPQRPGGASGREIGPIGVCNAKGLRRDGHESNPRCVNLTMSWIVAACREDRDLPLA